MSVDASSDTTEQEAERKPRKSVAFSEGTTIVDSDGQVTESKETNGGKSSAESHSTGSPALAGNAPCTQTSSYNWLTCRVTGDDKDVEEVTEMFADLAKKVRIPHHGSSLGDN